jgi:hypothetical protein
MMVPSYRPLNTDRYDRPWHSTRSLPVNFPFYSYSARHRDSRGPGPGTVAQALMAPGRPCSRQPWGTRNRNGQSPARCPALHHNGYSLVAGGCRPGCALARARSGPVSVQVGKRDCDHTSQGSSLRTRWLKGGRDHWHHDDVYLGNL